MAEPKKRRSKTRTRRARAMKKVKLMELNVCSQCKAQKQPHTVCKYCGYYNGKNVFN